MRPDSAALELCDLGGVTLPPLWLSFPHIAGLKGMGQTFLLQWRTYGPERVSDLLRVTQLVSGGGLAPYPPASSASFPDPSFTPITERPKAHP